MVNETCLTQGKQECYKEEHEIFDRKCQEI